MIGVLSDAHGHVRAFKKALAVLRRHGAAHIYFLGDAVGYLPSREVLDLLRDEDISCVRGNHDHEVGWPLERIVRTGTTSCHLVHGSPREPLTGYVYPDTPLDDLVSLCKANSVVMGHTHRPFVRTEAGVTFVNAGSCGLSRDDARFGSVALFDAKENERWRILRFNIEAETRRMIEEERISKRMKEFFDTRRSEEIVGDFVD